MCRSNMCTILRLVLSSGHLRMRAFINNCKNAQIASSLGRSIPARTLCLILDLKITSERWKSFYLIHIHTLQCIAMRPDHSADFKQVLQFLVFFHFQTRSISIRGMDHNSAAGGWFYFNNMKVNEDIEDLQKNYLNIFSQFHLSESARTI